MLTPEEYVRQRLISGLINQRQVPRGLFSVEQGNISARWDGCVHGRGGMPWLIFECKAPAVQLSLDSLLQVSRYQQKKQAEWVAISNGIQNMIMNAEDGEWRDGWEYFPDFA